MSKELFKAVKDGNSALAVMLVESGKCDPNSFDEHGSSVLCYACARGMVDLVRVLIERKARLDDRTPQDQGPLFFASFSGSADCVRELLKCGVSPSSKYCGVEAVPCIVVAASRNHLQVMHELLQGGAGIDETDAQGHTALHTACFLGNEPAAVFLAERGANVNLCSKKGATPLAWCASRGHIRAAKALLDKGANVDGAPHPAGFKFAPSEIERIPLLAAARSDKLDVLKLLLDRGAKIEARNENGETALHCGARGDALKCVRELLVRGAEFGAVDKDLKTIVEKASSAGKCETLEYLVKWEQHGGEPPAEEKTVEPRVPWQPDFSKIDPLYYKLASWIGESQALVAAAKAGDRSVVSSLLMQGADPNSVQSTSPLAAAARGGHHQCVLLLRMSGADPSVAVARKHLQPDAKGAEDESKEDPNERVPPVVIARENGHQSIVELLEHDAICGECAKPMTVNEAKRCAKCKIVKYCSVECQKKSWSKFHKQQCTIWAERKEMLKNRK